MKGAVAAGKMEKITFNFKPPKRDKFLSNIEAFEGIGNINSLFFNNIG